MAKIYSALLVLMVLVSVAALFSIGKNGMTGAAIFNGQESGLHGIYSVLPSFRAKADYSLEDYGNIKEKLKLVIDSCKSRQDAEVCIRQKTGDLGWKCEEENKKISYLIHDFKNKLTDCINLKENGVMCSFDLDDVDAEEKNLEILLEPEGTRTRMRLSYGNKVIATDYISLDNLAYADDYDNRDKKSKNLVSLKIIVSLEGGKPAMTKATGFTEDNKEVGLAKQFVVYKIKDGILFIDEAQESSFRAPYANTVVKVPIIRGVELCVNSGKKIYAYDASDNAARLRDMTYKFAVTFPKPPPKPIPELKVLDAPKAENSAILLWDMDKDAEAFNLYYSNKDFADIRMKDIKQADGIKKIAVPLSYAEIKDIELTRCNFNAFLEPCKYSLYGKPLEKSKLYYWAAEKKLFYVLPDVPDGIAHNFAVTAVDSLGNEIDNDKSLEGNTYVLTRDKNYRTITPIDDLAPYKADNLRWEGSPEGKAKVMWDKPLKNLDGSVADDIIGFSVYYKKVFAPSPELFNEDIDGTYIKIPVTLANANCASPIHLACDYTFEDLQSGYYRIGVAAFDQRQNEFLQSGTIQVLVP